jgi:hypothetical protein
MLLAVDFHLDAPKQVLIVVRAGKQAAASAGRVRSQFVLNRVLSFPKGKNGKRNPSIGRKEASGKATAYVCENRICMFHELIFRQLRQKQFPDVSGCSDVEIGRGVACSFTG